MATTPDVPPNDDDVLDDPQPVAEPSGPTPEPEPDPDAPSPDEPEPEPSDDGKPPSEDDEPQEWRSLEKKFHNITDDKERRRAIGQQYWEKTRYASETRKENERLKARVEELEEGRSTKPAARAEPEEPPAPHPDLERLDYRLSQLEERDGGLHDKQEDTLVQMGKVREDVAATKALLEAADESERARLEGRLERLEDKRETLQSRFDDLGERRETLRDKHEELTREREWAANLAEQQREEEQDERQSRQTFKAEFPTKVYDRVHKLADAAGLDPEDEGLRESMLTDIKNALTVKFWRLGSGVEATDKDVNALVDEEFERWTASRDIAARKAFKETSKEKLSVSGPRPTPAPSPRRSATPAPTEEEPAGYDAEPKDVTALGIQELSPSMKRGREILRKKGW